MAIILINTNLAAGSPMGMASLEVSANIDILDSESRSYHQSIRLIQCLLLVQMRLYRKYSLLFSFVSSLGNSLLKRLWNV